MLRNIQNDKKKSKITIFTNLDISIQSILFCTSVDFISLHPFCPVFCHTSGAVR